MSDSVELMRRIHAAMGMKKISIPEMCEKVGIGEATFWRYKVGKTAPPVDLVFAMGNVVGLSLEELVKDITTNPPRPPATDAVTGAVAEEPKTAA